MLRSSIALFALLAVAACGEAPNPRIASHVSSTLNDTGADAVIVTVERVEAHRSGGGWFALVDTAQTVDLISVAGDVSELWDERSAPAGHYTQVRLVLAGEGTVVIDGVESTLRVTSADETGLKVVGGFTLLRGRWYVLVLDFELDENLHQNSGGWVLNPTVKIESFEESFFPD